MTEWIVLARLAGDDAAWTYGPFAREEADRLAATGAATYGDQVEFSVERLASADEFAAWMRGDVSGAAS